MHTALTRYTRLTSALSWVAAQIAMLAVLAMALHILLEILLRAVFQTSTFVMDEFVGYEVAAMTFLGLGSALDHKVLLRLNLLLVRLSGRARAAVEIVNATLTLTIFGFLLYYLAKLALRNHARGTTSISVLEVPVWIPQAVIIAGIGIFCLQLTGVIAKALTAPETLD
ncbi:TRAP transporter small permease subunit [Pseudooceanicola aestuarii]|uniref:TRAP transporter small permease subunit n=1 Tax=Pseudooceanicola aestuarii TaxID=2697319 RepID=UPI0013D2019F|nr:TRAP transporter small permease [Pseudooceanicola aestuarii]